MAKLITKPSNWDTFANSGMLYLINKLLHVFGWVIVYEMDEETQQIVSVYPARTKITGFHPDLEVAGRKSLHAHLLKETAGPDAQLNPSYSYWLNNLPPTDEVGHSPLPRKTKRSVQRVDGSGNATVLEPEDPGDEPPRPRKTRTTVFSDESEEEVEDPEGEDLLT